MKMMKLMKIKPHNRVKAISLFGLLAFFQPLLFASYELIENLEFRNNRLSLPVNEKTLNQLLSQQMRQDLVNNKKHRLEVIAVHMQQFLPAENAVTIRIALMNHVFTEVFKKRIRLSGRKCLTDVKFIFHANGRTPVQSIIATNLHCNKGITGLDYLVYSSEFLEAEVKKVMKKEFKTSYLENLLQKLLNGQIRNKRVAEVLNKNAEKNIPQYVRLDGIIVEQKSIRFFLGFDNSQHRLP